jgi:hypothetical protein
MAGIGQHPREVFGGYWLHHVNIETCCGRLRFIRRLAPARNGNQTYWRMGRHSEPTRELVAVHPRQPDVKEDDLGTKLGRGRERPFAIVLDVRRMAQRFDKPL